MSEDLKIPSEEKFLKGIEKFDKHAERNAMYKIATFLVSHFWGNFSNMADGLGVLLLTWNQAFYRYGSLSFDKLEECIEDNFMLLKKFRKRNISSLSGEDEEKIKSLFRDFLEALKIDKYEERKSPVAVAKALHVLAPKFFPLWDRRIAKAYGERYGTKPAEKYLSFCYKMQEIKKQIGKYDYQKDESDLRLIDEYNYAKYTKQWID